MTGKFLIRSVGVLTCMAIVATGWDAEAGWRRHHHRRAACCEPVCCEPVCCEPVCCEPVCCEPVRCEPICCEPVSQPVCCEPVRETVCCETVIMAPAPICCTNRVVVTEKALPSSQASIIKTEPSQQVTAGRSTMAKAASLKR
jgi:hypothetical protein